MPVSRSGTKEEKKNTGGIIGLGYTTSPARHPSRTSLLNESNSPLASTFTRRDAATILVRDTKDCMFRDRSNGHVCNINS